MRRTSCAVSAAVVIAAGILIFRACGPGGDDALARECKDTRGLMALAIEAGGGHPQTDLMQRRLDELHGGNDLKDPDVQQAVFTIDKVLYDKDPARLLNAGYALQEACGAG
ncbi:hypothetical protein [Streptomyces sp. NBC_01465]|uniref:hypothetical protein n=1 Tax=Streptomyces sp. NBC_01465 TaxID=2903878 RepID=UPI002E33DDC0|nr:hypothetical protein [Streptomyces sp. NBC_01465]